MASFEFPIGTFDFEIDPHDKRKYIGTGITELTSNVYDAEKIKSISGTLHSGFIKNKSMSAIRGNGIVHLYSNLVARIYGRNDPAAKYTEIISYSASSKIIYQVPDVYTSKIVDVEATETTFTYYLTPYDVENYSQIMVKYYIRTDSATSNETSPAFVFPSEKTLPYGIVHFDLEEIPVVYDHTQLETLKYNDEKRIRVVTSLIYDGYNIY